MKATLRIPCYNEWCQPVSYIDPKLYLSWVTKKVAEHRSNIYETLNLLKPKIISWIFDRVIITNDWSTDNTLEEIERFKKENNLPNDKFLVIDNRTNIWKYDRFIEAYNLSKKLEQDIFVMTDADMIFAPKNNTFERLALYSKYWWLLKDYEMLISMQNESVSDWYLTFDAQTSWTRGLIIPNVQKKLSSQWIKFEHIWAQWYWLEIVLNALFWDNYIYINNSDRRLSIPHFLQPMRKWMDLQVKNVSQTQKTMRAFIQTKWLHNYNNSLFV